MATAAAVVAGSVISAVVSSRSAKKAARAQVQAAETGAEVQIRAAETGAEAQREASQLAIEEQRRQFDITQAGLAPFREAGISALQQQQALLGLGGVEAQQTAFAGLQESPGQQFLRERGQRNLLRSASAIGGIGGGNIRSALVQQGVGFAQQDLQNQLARLGQIAGQGQATALGLGQLGQATAGGISSLLSQQGLASQLALQQAGQARATGIQQAGQARVAGIQQRGAAFQQGLGGIFTGLAQGGVFSGGGGGLTLPASNVSPFARAA